MGEGEVEGAMQTPDGAWRVEVVRRGRSRWYRIVHGDDVFDWMSISAVERILDEAGVDRHTLVDAGPAGPERNRTSMTDPAPRAGDDGFTLLEMLVALAVIATVMASTAPFLTRSVAVVGQQRSEQVAIEVANDALERARALSPSSLLAGRGRTAVQNQLAAAPAAVTSVMALTETAADATLTSVTDLLAGANAPLPTVPVPVTVGGVQYEQSWYVGRCWQRKADATQPSVDLGPCAGTPPTGAGVVPVPFFRVVVGVTWPHTDCDANRCTYVASTLVSPNADPVFDLKRPPPKIARPDNRGNYVGDAATVQLVAAGGSLPRTWTLTGLPPGLTYSSNGVITGTTTTAGTYTVLAHVQDRDGVGDDASFTWTVAAPPSLTAPAAQVFRTTKDLPLQVQLTGGLQPVTWSAANLPPGLAINTSTGVISGVPTTLQAAAQTATVTVTAGKKSATTTFSWRVATPVTLYNPGSFDATKGDNGAYDIRPLAVGGLPPYTWRATGMPPGMTMTGGITSGIISAGTRYLVTVEVTDSANYTATTTALVNVAARVATDLRVTAPNPAAPDQTSTVNAPVSLTAAAAGTSGYVWSATGLPPGLTMNAAGLVSGQPSTAGTYVTTLTVTDGTQVAKLMLTWRVNP